MTPEQIAGFLWGALGVLLLSCFLAALWRSARFRRDVRDLARELGAAFSRKGNALHVEGSREGSPHRLALGSGKVARTAGTMPGRARLSDAADG